MKAAGKKIIVGLETEDRIINANFLALFGSVFFLFFAFDFYVPVLPFYVLEVGGREASIGLLMGLFTFCSIILRPFQGRTINNRGRKRLLLTGIVLYATAGLGLLLMPSLYLLFLFRAVQGFGWGAFLLAFNTLALDLAPPARRGEILGLIGMAPPFSLAIAPIISENLRLYTGGNYHFLFLIASLAALFSLLFAALVREPQPQDSSVPQRVLFSPKVFVPSLIIFFLTFNLGGIITFLPLLGETRDIRAVGLFFTLFALTALLFRPLAGRLSDRVGRHPVFIPGMVVSSAALVMIATAQSSPQLLTSAVILGLGFSSVHSPVLAMAADSLPVAERGVGMATFTASFDLGIVAGAVILGLLLGRIGFTALFVICAIVMLMPIFIYLCGRIISGHNENYSNK